MESPAKRLLGGRYQILGQLGRGGMAQVFHAQDLNLHREVAVKLLHESYIHDPAFQARFLQEARAAANLIHPNIVTVYDFGHDAGRYFLVMEYVPGTDLKSLIRRRGRIPSPEALELMTQICAGVGYAHRAGLVHCDLKPQNVLVGNDGRAKITDFGIARALASIQPDEISEVVWGSPVYLSPEQSAGGAPSPASDVYALGVVLFEMLTGRQPFTADSAEALAVLHQTAAPPAARMYQPEVPEPLNQVLLKILSKEPAARYRTADQLGRVLDTLSTTATPGDDPPPEDAVPVLDSGGDAHTLPMGSSPNPTIDWTSVALALLAFLALGGLIPLWLTVCLRYPTCPFSP
jgi:serine/threonine-protein kinase